MLALSVVTVVVLSLFIMLEGLVFALGDLRARANAGITLAVLILALVTVSIGMS